MTLFAAPPPPLVRAEGLTRQFALRSSLFGGGGQVVRAVTDVSFTIPRGTTLGLVGESGCGKTTVGRLLLGLLPPTAGRAFVGDAEVTALAAEPLRRLRRRMQMVFQDPYASLNPRMSVADAIAEPLEIHLPELSAAARRDRVDELLGRVGLHPEHGARMPGEFSGGQRQRIVIARALAAGPDLIVADEPVSALDVSIQAQIVNLLRDLQRERGLTYLFVSHDLKVVRHIATRVAVMYLGRVVEEAAAARLFASPAHPYTQALLSAIPDVRAPRGRSGRVVLDGEPPSPLRPPPGCAFHLRCPLARRLAPADRQRCSTEVPSLRPVSEPASLPHLAACHYPEYS